jgi:acyl carrier protein
MNHLPQLSTSEAVIALVADTFDVPLETVTTATQPGEVPGWDSLGHSVLLTRLARRFGLRMTEDLAAPVDTVAELVEIVHSASAAAPLAQTGSPHCG